MNDKYNGNCMKFSNEELKNYMVEYLINNSWDRELIKYFSDEGDELEGNSLEKIGIIVFDGEKENLFINFFGVHTSIFVYGLEIMFIDEASRNAYTSSDIFNNVVYEGDLREMSHEEMLQMFSEIILCFIDATEVSMTQLDAPENMYKKYKYYEPHMFIVDVKNNHMAQKTSTYENITINY